MPPGLAWSDFVSDSDSFIEEVTEEVRRDRLFGYMRRYGWIGVAVIALIVAGAALNEWRKAGHAASARAFGDAVALALEGDDPPARLAALEGVEAGSSESEIVLALLRAGELVEDGRHDEALEMFREVFRDPGAPGIYKSLAQLKALLIETRGMDPAGREEAFRAAAAPGAPFRLLAREQIALARIESGDIDGGAGILRDILLDPAAGPGLRFRVSGLLEIAGVRGAAAEAGAGDPGEDSGAADGQ